MKPINNKGISNVLIILVVLAVIAGVVGYIWYSSQGNMTEEQANTQTESVDEEWDPEMGYPTPEGDYEGYGEGIPPATEPEVVELDGIINELEPIDENLSDLEQ